MKSYKFLMASAAALSLAGLASAATTVKITGSTAFRKSTMTAIINKMGTSYKAYYISTSTGAGDLGGLQSANYAIIQGNITGANNPVTIQCSWAGSVGGIYAVTQGVNLSTTKWISSSELPGTTSTYITDITASTTLESGSATADITLSDTQQSTTPFTTPVLTKRQVGVVPFVWIKSSDAPSTLNNITALQARALLQGSADLAMFTADYVNDSGIPVYAIGRDPDSGTRVAAFADSGYGSQTLPVQFTVTSHPSGVETIYDSVQFAPGGSFFGITYNDGESGYASGSGVATALSCLDLFANVGAHFIGYVGTADAVKVRNAANAVHSQDSGTGVISPASGENQILAYNGVTYSYDNVRNGKYTFWTYEYLMHKSTLGADATTVATLLATEIHDVTASLSGIQIGTMHVSRQTEGAVVTP